jgi:hypothetical protein
MIGNNEINSTKKIRLLMGPLAGINEKTHNKIPKFWTFPINGHKNNNEHHSFKLIFILPGGLYQDTNLFVGSRKKLNEHKK